MIPRPGDGPLFKRPAEEPVKRSRLQDEDITVCEQDGFFRIHLRSAVAASLDQHVGWWKSRQRAESECRDLKLWLRDRGVME